MHVHRKESAELHVQLLGAKLLEKEGHSIEDALKDVREKMLEMENDIKSVAKTQLREVKWERRGVLLALHPKDSREISSKITVLGAGPFCLWYGRIGRLHNILMARRWPSTNLSHGHWAYVQEFVFRPEVFTNGQPFFGRCLLWFR